MSEDDESFYALKKKYDKTKRELQESEKYIRRITGRDPDEVSNGASKSSKFRPNSFVVAEKPSYTGRKRAFSTKEDSPEIVDLASDDSSPETSPKKKFSLQSRIVAKSHPSKSRKDTIIEQNANSKIKARNRRMFGALIGTLEKFQTEEKKRKNVVSMRAEIEKKVEAATEEQREKIKKEKEKFIITRKEKQIQLRCLEKKIERAEIHEAFENAHKNLRNFMKTKSKPPVYFKPRSHTTETKKCLEESRNKLNALLKKKKAEFDADMAEITESYRKDSESVSVVFSGDEKEDHIEKDVRSKGNSSPKKHTHSEKNSRGKHTSPKKNIHYEKNDHGKHNSSPKKEIQSEKNDDGKYYDSPKKDINVEKNDCGKSDISPEKNIQSEENNHTKGKGFSKEELKKKKEERGEILPSKNNSPKKDKSPQKENEPEDMLGASPDIVLVDSEEDEQRFKRHCGDSVSDQEFEPIYD